MIFKHFFRPKYQDPNPQVRIQAIANLIPEESQHKSQLHELAFNDEDPNVSLAALTRLNSFALWCKMADTAKSERVKKRAQTMVENALFDQGDLVITDQERKRFIAECKSNSLLEKLLQLPSVKNDESGLLLTVLNKLNKPHVTKQQFINSNNEKVQLSLLAYIEDESTLSKGLKRTSFSVVEEAIRLKLKQIEEAKLKPIEIEKDAKLVLSQLLALKDKSDFVQIKQQNEALVKSFLSLQPEFTYLKDETEKQLNARFDEIKQKISHLIQQLAPQFEAAERANGLNKGLNEIQQKVNSILAEVNLELAQDVEKVTLGAVESYEHALQDCQQQLAGILPELTDLHSLKEVWDDISAQIIQCRSTLERLPEFKKAVTLGKEFIEKFKRLESPTDISQINAAKEYLAEQTAYWQDLSSPYGSGWPKELNTQWQACRKEFNAGLNKLIAGVKQNENRCKAKLRAIDSLISQGKYNAAMGLYSKVITWYEQLPERNQQHISRQLESIKEQIENLKDWQHYIAQPRKPAVLKEAETIALHPLEIDQQVAKVKRLRSAWNSLGNTGAEADTLLNKAFDMAIEKAFEPCRLHFAEMEAQRKENEQLKLGLIEQSKLLQTSDKPISDIADEVMQIQQRWRQVGKVDYKILDAINQAYANALKPLKERVQKFHHENAEAKQLLINKAQLLLENEEINDAVEQAKKLQLQWKEIGNAGRKQDSLLWKEFRSINDSLFAKRNDLQANTKLVQQKQTEEAERKLDDILGLANTVNSLGEIEHASEQLQQFAATFDIGNGNKVSKSIHHKIAKIEKLLLSKKDSLHNDKKRKVLVELFELLAGSNTEGETNELLEHLPQAWKQAYLNQKNSDFNRNEIAVLLEILDSQDSPQEDSQLRKNLQLQMMTDKLQHGEQIDKDNLLIQFIQHGKLSSDAPDKERRLIERVKSHFIQ
ncbi:DUF349 domain-containing protein [Aliiglaciecola sp. 3_MG-2023]|uniref:DUF349 domain-containing protein n=1 Tax=Aliiglaciecola sp. 3_MG-2023 TaxID=3062644 RepID=UPI0026E40671|nr:DUF349 domain-containing protein [Aliiglaciecola sp. 3_MG-2023]MDO6692396.1 DUF349 domain-containing protein [Aliiglaciecola sp. 3_MG-2023]